MQVSHISDFTQEAEQQVRAEMRRRSMPEPPAVVRDMTMSSPQLPKVLDKTGQVFIALALIFLVISIWYVLNGLTWSLIGSPHVDLSERLAKVRTNAIFSVILYLIGDSLRSGRRAAIYGLGTMTVLSMFYGARRLISVAEAIFDDQFLTGTSFFVGSLVGWALAFFVCRPSLAPVRTGNCCARSFSFWESYEMFAGNTPR